MTVLTESDFTARLHEALADRQGRYDWVSGPGRSGAIAAAYASFILDVPFVPFGHMPRVGGLGLMIDIAAPAYGRLEKAARRYPAESCLLFHVDEPRPSLWFEARPSATNVRIFNRSAA